MIKISITLVAFLISISAFANSSLVPESIDDHGPDLPTVGSSVFDKIFTKTSPTGEVVYDVPYPLEKLLDKIKQRGQFVHTMFPFSRSLQRPQDLSYDPILNPRFVFAPRRNTHVLTTGKLFMGLVKAKDQIEVISYNDEAGRYEYQLIDQYSKDPKVFYVNRGKCLTCHQGQAGIFSPAPWSDSTFGLTMGKILDRKLEMAGTNRNRFVESYFGRANTREFLFVIDDLVRLSNKIATDERVWVYGCDKDPKCRLGLLFNTICRNCSRSSEYSDYSKSVLRQSSLVNDKKFSSFLTSFDIDGAKTVIKYGSLDSAVGNSQFSLDMISNLYQLLPANNPATKRPMPMTENDLLLPLKSFSDLDISTLRKEFVQTSDLEKALLKVYREQKELFAKKAVNSVQIMASLLKEASSTTALEYEYWVRKKTPAKKLFHGRIQPIFQKKELNIFSRYCHQCHASGLRFPPQFLIGNELQVEEKLRNLKSRLKFKLKNKLMPPNRDSRELLHSSGDYSRIMNYLDTL